MLEQSYIDLQKFLEDKSSNKATQRMPAQASAPAPANNDFDDDIPF